MGTPSVFDPQSGPYKIDPDLKVVVEMALELGMPLLVTGEPGTGKTRLAEYLAKEHGAEYRVFNTKTSSKAKDLLYRYNALTHFRDANQEKETKAIHPMDYVAFEALGEAIVWGHKKRYVVLIDEIDKAPRDFPNDVLFEFDKLAFRVEEASIEELAGREDTEEQVDENGFFCYRGDKAQRPILILTSNSEKNLPDAFLRRCCYFHIPFPKPDRLLEIVHANIAPKEGLREGFIKDALDYFSWIREKVQLNKKPATAELLAWIHILNKRGIDVIEAITKQKGNDREMLEHSLSILAKNKDDLQKIKDEFGRYLKELAKKKEEAKKGPKQTDNDSQAR